MNQGRWQFSLRSYYSVHFMRGRGHSLLLPSHRKAVIPLINKDTLSDSFFLYNSTAVAHKVAAWKNRLPWIRPFYAMKSNPMSLILKDTINAGCGMDCASKDEIIRALEHGLSPADIVYSNVVKTEGDLIAAQQFGIQLTTADTLEQAQKVRTLAPNMSMLWRISIKEDPTAGITTCFSNKFGDNINSAEEAHARFKLLADLGHRFQGIHFHCGSGHNGSNGFKKAVKMARTCLAIGREYGHPMKTLDIGGGFPSGHLTDQLVSMLKPTQSDPLGYRVIAEPGRYISSSTCHLLTRIIGRRIKQERICYHINDSVYHSFNCKLMDGMSYDNDTDQVYACKEGKQLKPTNLFGMTCDGMDIIGENIMMPEMGVGDWLCISEMGAYTIGPKSTFNGMHSGDRIEILPESESVKINKVQLTH